jgi:fatty-acyl-CoA synthase
MKNLADWTAYWARRRPSAPALIEPHRALSRSYRDLDRRANRLAHALEHSCGVKRGDRVAILAHNRSEHFELLFACAKLGALFVPLNWRLAAAELDAVLADCEPTAFLYDRPCAEIVSAMKARAPRQVALDEPSAGGQGYEALIEKGSDGAAGSAEVSLEDPLMICYTSGTTGRPKGALLSHRQLVFNSLSTALAIGLSPDDATLVFMPLFHTGGLNCLATPLLHHGGRVVLMPGFDAERALQLSAAERVTLQMGVPTIFQMLRDAPSFAKTDLSATRTALCGGAPCPLGLIEDYRARGVLFRQGFGMTEVGPNCFSLTEEDAFEKAGSIGWPNFYLEADIGEGGELLLGGPMVTLGYFRNPEATEQAFRGTRFFHTGDVVRRDDQGYYYVIGRKKEMFISGGENVYPAEVELAIAALEGVLEACVIGMPDAKWGEVGRAVVVRRPGAVVEERALLAWLAGRLAKYKVPKSVVFADELPKNASGKVLRPMVRERWGK